MHNKSNLLNVSVKLLCLTVFAFVFSSMIIFFYLVRSVLITDSYEEMSYEEINLESQINLLEYIQIVTKNENEIYVEDVLSADENDSDSI